MSFPSLILASGSPYRKNLLQRLRLPFSVVVSNVNEHALSGETPAETALRLAQTKAKTVAKHHPNTWIIGSDQVAVCVGQSLEKPDTHARALAQLQAMQGQMVEFHSALCLIADPHPIQSANVVTYVRFRKLPDSQLNAYLELEQPFDVAGSVKLEGFGIRLVESIQSEDPTAVIGSPLITLTHMLETAGLSF